MISAAAHSHQFSFSNKFPIIPLRPLSMPLSCSIDGIAACGGAAGCGGGTGGGAGAAVGAAACCFLASL